MDDIDGMGRIVNQYFSNIFTSRSPQLDDIDTMLQTRGARVDESINRELCRVFTPDEIHVKFWIGLLLSEIRRIKKTLNYFFVLAGR